MITQTIKHWLCHLFAWWPWKRTTATAYGPPIRNEAISILQEHPWTDEGSLPQTDASFVVVEQGNDDAMPEATSPFRPPSIEHVDIITQSPTLRDVSSLSRLPQDEKTLENLTLSNAQFGSASETTLTPISEQHLAFLSYLVSHGLINEGFEEGDVPEQYRKKS